MDDSCHSAASERLLAGARRCAKWCIAGSLLAALSVQGAPESVRSSLGLAACSIEEAREVPGGVSLRFEEKTFWRFRDSLGNQGVIGIGGVVRLVERPEGEIDVLPAEWTLSVQSGAQLTLSDHHSACVILVDSAADRVLLRIHSSFGSTTHAYQVLL